MLECVVFPDDCPHASRQQAAAADGFIVLLRSEDKADYLAGRVAVVLAGVLLWSTLLLNIY